jgi:hypothetical protein
MSIGLFFFFLIDERNGYKGGSFPLFIRKDKRMSDPKAGKGMGSLTINNPIKKYNSAEI